MFLFDGARCSDSFEGLFERLSLVFADISFHHGRTRLDKLFGLHQVHTFDLILDFFDQRNLYVGDNAVISEEEFQVVILNFSK